MHLRILGCHGGETPTHHATSFLIDQTILIDAGSATRNLTLQEQLAITDLYLSHVHLDHTRDLAMLTDNLIAIKKNPLRIHCSAFTASALKQHYFNDILWPNFTKIPNPADPQKRPVIEFKIFDVETPFALGHFDAETVPVNHPVDCHALFLSDKNGTLVYSGDTGPTVRLWEKLNDVKRLYALIYEVSFANSQEKLAHSSGHLTTHMMQLELGKFHNPKKRPILLNHIKPNQHNAVLADLHACHGQTVQVLQPEQTFDWPS